MKAALVIGRYDGGGGGAERWTDRHARFLLSQGVEVHLISAGFVAPPSNAVCHQIDKGWGAGRRLRFAERVARLCRREGFDVVHDMGDGWHCDFFMPHHGTRASTLERNLDLLSPAARCVQDWAYRWTPRYLEFAELERRQYAGDADTTYIAVSQMVQRDMQRRYGVPAERIRLVYNGVDAQRFHPRRGEARPAAWPWPDRVVHLLAAHNFELKGLSTLVRATARLRSEGAPVGLAVLGSGRPGPYRRLAHRLGCEDSIVFLGNQPDPLPYFQSADVYVQPTFYDPCSLVVLEALACGLPVVTTRQNGASELLTSGLEGAVLDDPRDVEALAEAMRRYLDRTARENAGRAARRLAERRTLARNSSAILDLYRERLGLPVRRVA